jgi:branched-subunit amino acid transport protein
MTAWTAILGVSVGSYLLRVLPLLRSRPLATSDRVQRTLRHGGLGGIAALVISTTSGQAAVAGWAPTLAAVGAALLVAARHRSMVQVVAVGGAVAALVALVT